VVKKSQKKTVRPVRQTTPVIAVRTPQVLYDRVKYLAEISGATMSDTVALLLENGFRCQDYDDAFGRAAEIIRWAKTQALAIEAARAGFLGQKAGPPNTEPQPAPAEPPPLTDSDRAKVKAVMDEFERRIEALLLQPSQQKGAG
jgi:hypothetical protein